MLLTETLMNERHNTHKGTSVVLPPVDCKGSDNYSPQNLTGNGVTWSYVYSPPSLCRCVHSTSIVSFDV